MLTQKYVPVARKSALEILFKVRFMLLTRGGGYPLASLMSLPTPNRFRHYSKHGLCYMGLGPGCEYGGRGRNLCETVTRPLWPGCPGVRVHTRLLKPSIVEIMHLFYIYIISYIYAYYCEHSRCPLEFGCAEYKKSVGEGL